MHYAMHYRGMQIDIAVLLAMSGKGSHHMRARCLDLQSASQTACTLASRGGAVVHLQQIALLQQRP